ncbi:MAG: F0F1 ATP synthase subunit epsilon [Motiliproteus sp.]
MNSFQMRLLDSQGGRDIDRVEAFVGNDQSGSFSIWAQHQRFITLLEFGLARYRCHNDDWVYIAMPGALLHVEANLLQLVSRRFIIDSDYQRISQLLTEQLLAEEQALQATKRSLRHMEEEIIRQLWQHARGSEGLS